MQSTRRHFFSGREKRGEEADEEVLSRDTQDAREQAEPHRALNCIVAESK